MIHFNDFNLNEFSKQAQKNLIEDENKHIYYYNIPFTLDIETSSFKIVNGVAVSNDESIIYKNGKKLDIGDKCAFCYIWQMSLNGITIFGRSLEELQIFLFDLQKVLQLDEKKRIIIYIHNLSYEFQFIRKYLNITYVFARTVRKPLYAIVNNCIELKCSYMLSGLSLEKVAENLQKHSIKKLVGELNYSLLRNSYTDLTIKELQYAENDVLIIHYFILEEMEKNNNLIFEIPLTKTGYCRRYTRECIKKYGSYEKHRAMIKACYPTPKQFILLARAYQGGYTHANVKYVDEVLNNVASYDFESSYPAQCVFKKFPYKFEKIHIKKKSVFYKFINKYCCLFSAAFTNVKAKSSISILSTSKCKQLKNVVADNGRIVQAESLITYMTELDFKSFDKFYTYDDIIISEFYFSKPKKLPNTIIQAILDLYRDKTELKGVAGKEQEYLVSKGLLNAIYGMCVTSPVADEIFYNDEWNSSQPDLITALEEHKKSYSTFLLYQWGVWVSAHARFELLESVWETRDDVIYSDTDSNKLRNYHKYENYFNEYNKKKQEEFAQICNEFNYEQPIKKNGEKACLGIWDFEGIYDTFKTLGAKRYCYEVNDNFYITVAGLNKKKGANYISKQEKPFDFFSNEMLIPQEHTGKLTMTYIDIERYCILKDYQGNVQKISVLSCTHSEPQDYHLTLANEFIDYILNVKEDERTGNILNKKKHNELSINFIDTLGY